MAASEAVLHEPNITIESLKALLLAIPRNGYSAQSDTDLDASARAIAKDKIAQAQAGKPIYSGCGFRNAAGHLAETFSELCTEVRSHSCGIGLWPYPGSECHRYGPLLRSSIWRDGRGKGMGLGLATRMVYEYLLARARGNAIPVEASQRFLADVLPLSEKAARAALRRLCEFGLLESIGKSEFRVCDPPTLIAIRDLEATLGTGDLDFRARKRRSDERRTFALISKPLTKTNGTYP